MLSATDSQVCALEQTRLANMARDYGNRTTNDNRQKNEHGSKFKLKLCVLKTR